MTEFASAGADKYVAAVRDLWRGVSKQWDQWEISPVLKADSAALQQTLLDALFHLREAEEELAPAVLARVINEAGLNPDQLVAMKAAVELPARVRIDGDEHEVTFSGGIGRRLDDAATYLVGNQRDPKPNEGQESRNARRRAEEATRKVGRLVHSRLTGTHAGSTGMPEPSDGRPTPGSLTRSYKVQLETTVVLGPPGHRPVGLSERRVLTPTRELFEWSTCSTSGQWPADGVLHFGVGRLNVRPAPGGLIMALRFDPPLPPDRPVEFSMTRSCPHPIPQSAGRWPLEGRGTVELATMKLQWKETPPRRAWWYHVSHPAELPTPWDPDRSILIEGQEPEHTFTRIPIGDHVGIAWEW